MLELANGLVVDPTTGQVISQTVVPSEQLTPKPAKLHQPPADVIARQVGRDMSNLAVRKMLADFPAEPKLISSVGLVWFYFHLGIPEYEISSALGITEDQILHIKGLKLFSELDKRIRENQAVLAQSDITESIGRLAPRAMNKLNEIMETSEDENLQAKIASNMLDRAGYGAKSLVEHRVTVDGGLIIRHIDDDSEKEDESVLIDVSPNFEDTKEVA